MVCYGIIWSGQYTQLRIDRLQIVSVDSLREESTTQYHDSRNNIKLTGFSRVSSPWSRHEDVIEDVIEFRDTYTKTRKVFVYTPLNLHPVVRSCILNRL